MKIQIEVILFSGIIDDVKAHHIDADVTHDYDECCDSG